MLEVYCENPQKVSLEFCNAIEKSMGTCRLLARNSSWVKVYAVCRPGNLIGKKEYEFDEHSDLSICFNKLETKVNDIDEWNQQL